MARYCLIGPTYPFRGGIAHYTTLLARALRQESELLFVSFTRQYPTWLFPGRSDRDPSKFPLTADAEYMIDSLNPITWLRAARRIRRWRPEAVIIPWWVPFWAPAWSIIGRLVKRSAYSPRLIFVCHNVIPHEPRFWDRWALRLALSPADGFILHSQADASVLLDYFPAANYRVTPLPTYGEVGLGESAEAAGDLFPDGCHRLLFFGIIRHYKGLDILLEAMARVTLPVHLLVAGDFWEPEERYRQQIEQLEIADRVTIINEYIPDERLAQYIRAADVAVLPYRSATQSAVIQLAFGHGLPVVTTCVGGLAEVVNDGHTGLLVPPDDPEALASAIHLFLKNALAKPFAANIAAAHGRFGWTALCQVLADFADEPKASVVS